MSSIYLRRKQKIFVPVGESVVLLESGKVLDKGLLVSFLANLSVLGYTVSQELYDALEKCEPDYFIAVHKAIIGDIRKMLGANVEYHPMYPNFPDQVAEASDAELIINAVIHYWSEGTILPAYEKKMRDALVEPIELKVIGLGTIEDYREIFINLMKSPTSLSEQDIEDLEHFFMYDFYDNEDLIPNEIPSKENLATVSKLLIQYTQEPQKFLQRYYKTATDVLRFATALSDGDVSLASNTKFKKFSRKERRMLLGLLEQCGYCLEDMFRYRGKWLRLGEILHPNQYAKRYPKTVESFSKLRKGEKTGLFNSKVEKMIKDGDYQGLVSTLSKRPGEFARRLDHILRISDDQEMVVNAFKAVAQDVSTPVLLQVRTHFESRDPGNELRVFFPKGQDSKVYGMKNNIARIDDKVCLQIYQICTIALIAKYSQTGDMMGKVYIDEELRRFNVPFSQRSASKGFKVLTRGSRIPLSEDAKVLRAFCHWMNPNGTRMDVDLSAIFYDEDWSFMDSVWYHNPRALRALHSGDITNAPAPDGACEFIDIDFEAAVEAGVRYVVLGLNNYTGYNFSELNDCFMGWMERQDPTSGEIFEAKAVKNKFNVAVNKTVASPMIIDVVNREVIWADMSFKGNAGNGGNNVLSNYDTFTIVCKSIVEMKKPNLYDLFNLHATGKGVVVKNREEADLVFAIDGDVTPYDIDVIMGEYL